jgi:hypothetical protein
MAPRVPSNKSPNRPGRRKIHLGPWLQEMHQFVLEGHSERKAAKLVVDQFSDQIPQGGGRRRSPESTIDLLRRGYPDWLDRKAGLERKRARLIELEAKLNEAQQRENQSDTSMLQVERALARALVPINQEIQRIALDVRAIAKSLGLPETTAAIRKADFSFEKVISSRKTRNSSQHRTK